MKLTPQNIVRHELVGLSTHIVESKDPNHVCKKGVILSESKEMIQISTERGTISVPKGICVFDMTLPDDTVVRIDGGLLRGRPEDRMKKRLNRSW
ncbi:MAG: Ribonuclease P protein component 1 [Candidatus Thorarchaeota archaeon AB_25]|jgi:ribonuclease P protein subunit POP4|nr:MAG: Ribonuclease P protein component 1 [Candidatus Thorarchaeota archaeon AB_25]